MPTIMTTVKQNVTAMQNLITASCCSCVIARNWLISFNGFIRFYLCIFRFNKLVWAGACAAAVRAFALFLFPVVRVLTFVSIAITTTKPYEYQRQTY